MRRISNSEMWTFKRCRRKWWLGTHRRLRPKSDYDDLSLPMTVGNAIHEALQIYYSPETPFDQDAAFHTMYAFLDKLENEHSVEQLDTINDARSYGQRMLEGYFQWLAETGVDAGLMVEASETIAGVELEGVVLSAKMDTRLHNELTGGRQFMDHKTVGSFNKIKKTFQMNEQFKTYSLIDHLTKAEHERADGGIANMLRRVKRTASAKPPFYDRVSVNHGVDTLRNFYHQVVGTIREIQRAEQRLEAGERHVTVCPPSPEDSCTWQCDFFKVCALLDSAPEAAESRLQTEYEEHDPYERYQEVKVLPAAQSQGG